jgi:hypothetical protein
MSADIMSIKVAGILAEVLTKPLHTLLDAIGLGSSFLTMSGIADMILPSSLVIRKYEN